MKSVKVFISHAHGESELAALLKSNLTEDFIGLVEVFVSSDFKSISAGQDWYDAIMTAVQGSDVHLVLCSQDSITSPWINIELGGALCGKERKVLPICHTNLRAADFKVRPLADKRGLDASDPDGLAFLYSTVARTLGSAVPRVNFAAFAATVREIEARYLVAKQTKARSIDCPVPENARAILPKPRVLCITSSQFLEVVQKDLERIMAAFPEGARHETVTDPAILKDLMVQERFDIIHVANQTCPVTGDLIFSPVSPGDRFGCAQRLTLRASGFAELVQECGAALVVLANNETLPLMIRILPVTSVAFAEEPVDLSMFIAWLETFYGLLGKNYSLVEACRKTYVQHQIPVRLYPRVFTGAAAGS